MKQCPVCKTNYTDATLSYCLADGAALAEMADEQPTVVRPSGEPMRVQIPQDTAPSVAPQTYQQVAPPPSGSSGGLWKVLLGIVLVVGILVVIAGVAGAFIYFNMNRAGTVSGGDNSNTKTAATPSPTPDDLRDQLANLQRLLNEQKNNNRAANVPPPPAQPGTMTMARVNSPSDGFLALRTLPSSSAGSRILQIPHGAMVSVGGCLGAGRAGSGRWCRASYDGYSGWVYDSYLIY